jgi:hypothetical protein
VAAWTAVEQIRERLVASLNSEDQQKATRSFRTAGSRCRRCGAPEGERQRRAQKIREGDAPASR